MALSMKGAQVLKDRMCFIHPNEKLLRVCQTCKFKPVCVECLASGKHAEHALITIDDAAEIRRGNLNTLLTAANQKKTTLTSAIQKTTNKLSTETYDHIIQRIESREATLISLVKNSSKSLKKKTLQAKEKYFNSLQKYKSDKKAHLEDISEYTKRIENKIDSMSSLEIIHITDLLTFSLKRQETDVPLDHIAFTENSLAKISIGLFFGQLSVNDLTRKTLGENESQTPELAKGEVLSQKAGSETKADSKVLEFEYEHPVLTIQPIDGGMTWITHSINCAYQNKIDLVLLDGTVIEKIELNAVVTDVTKSPSGNVLICCMEDKSVRTVIGDSTYLVFNTKDTPASLACTIREEIIVSFRANGKVVKYSDAGKVLKKLKTADKPGRKYGASRPYKVSVCQNTGNIAVVDDENPPSVLLVSEDLQPLWRYNGNTETKTGCRTLGWTDYEFKPIDVVFDKEGNLLIADYYYTVIMVDSAGFFLRILDKDLPAIPRTIKFDDDFSKLWIGLDNGIVKILAYNPQAQLAQTC